jgi:nicotinamide-nucleotide amidase
MLYDQDKLNTIKEKLLKRKKTLSVAESVTSGHLQAAFSYAPDATRFFQGGLTAYNAGQKTRQLDIEPIYAMEDNCVSQQVANNMATNINKIFLSDYGLGITGYASVVPELNIHSLHAFVAISYNDKIILSQKITSAKKDSVDVQIDYTSQVLDLLLSTLQNL